MVLPMDITRNTPDQLIIDDTPWLLGAVVIGVILTFASSGVSLILNGVWAGLVLIVVICCVGLAIFAAFIRRVQLILDRPAGTITLRTKTLFGLTEMIHDLPDLSRATLEVTIGGKGGKLYRPSLILDQGMSVGTHPIIPTYVNSSGPKRMVDAINIWLNTDPS